MLKVCVSLFMPHHKYNTRLKSNGDLNIVKFNKIFLKMNPIHVGIDL